MTNTILSWLKLTSLCIISCVISQIGLFAGVIENKKGVNTSVVIRILLSITFLVVQLMFMVPFIEIGMQMMNPVQLVLFVFFWTFVIQLLVNVYVFGNVNTLDDYLGIIWLLIGMSISQFRLFT
jgi:hypothetical protein